MAGLCPNREWLRLALHCCSLHAGTCQQAGPYGARAVERIARTSRPGYRFHANLACALTGLRARLRGYLLCAPVSHEDTWMRLLGAGRLPSRSLENSFAMVMQTTEVGNLDHPSPVRRMHGPPIGSGVQFKQKPRSCGAFCLRRTVVGICHNRGCLGPIILFRGIGLRRHHPRRRRGRDDVRRDRGAARASCCANRARAKARREDPHLGRRALQLHQHPLQARELPLEKPRLLPLCARPLHATRLYRAGGEARHCLSRKEARPALLRRELAEDHRYAARGVRCEWRRVADGVQCRRDRADRRYVRGEDGQGRVS